MEGIVIQIISFTFGDHYSIEETARITEHPVAFVRNAVEGLS